MSQGNPWEAFAAEHRRNERITCTISRIVSDIGLFAALGRGIDGIVHLGDLDWMVPGEEVIAHYSVGDPIEVVILCIQPEMQRISLGIKQLKPDPRSDQPSEPPEPTPVRPNNPKPPKPLSEAAEHD